MAPDDSKTRGAALTGAAGSDSAADRAAEAEAFLARHPDIEQLDAFVIDLSGAAVGKRYPASDLAKIYAKGTQMCAGAYALNVRGAVADAMGLGFSDGDPDADMRPVPGGLAVMPWSEKPRAQCLMRLYDTGTETPVWSEPRHILETVAARCAADGLRPVQALELEFYLLDAERAEGAPPRTIFSPRTGARDAAGRVYRLDVLDEYAEVLDAITANCRAQGIPAQAVSSEYSPGQFEINLEHTGDPLAAADAAALMRRCVTETARAKGYDATFLAKPFAGASGNGLHIHMSMLDAEGRNIFAEAPGEKPEDGPLGCAIAGMQAAMAESMAIFAPHLNAFRRFKANNYTPVTKDWGENNRSMAFRVPASDPKNRRIEHRAAGADANPYLTLAAVLAGAHHGLSKQLTPTPKAAGNAGAAMDETLPFTLWDALARLRDAPILEDYMGARYVELYRTMKEAEFRDFMAEIHPREHDWYL